MNAMKIDWNEAQNKANRAQFTQAPTIREQVLPQVAKEFTENQLIAASQKRYSFDGMASAFVWDNRAKLRYVPQRGKWVYWDGHVWSWDDTGHAQELVKATGRQLLTLEATDDDMKKIYAHWHSELTKPKGIADLLKAASTDPMMVVSIDDFDADIYGLNTPGGLVDLRTGALTPATPDNLVKRSTNVAPDAACPTPLYDRLMSETFAGEPELSEYLEQAIGMALIKAQDDQVFFYLYGEPGSGKGTLMNIVTDILGRGDGGYVSHVDSSMFTESRGGAHPTEYMQFLGARLAISSEVAKGQKMDSAKLKKTTGGDPITGRYMQKDFVTFDATHTLFIMANDKLQVEHGDGGVWRRLKVVEFKHKKRENVIGGLDKLIVAQEAPGVLAKWIAKAQKYLTEGYAIPDAVVDAGTVYIAESDTVAEWLEACCEVEDMASNFVIGEALRDSYMTWTKREKRTALGSREFTQALTAKGFTSTRQYVTAIDSTKKQYRGFFGLAIA